MQKTFRMKRTFDDRLVSIVSYTVITFFAIVCLFPFVYIIGTSFMSYGEYLEAPMRIFPHEISFSAYEEIFGMKLIYTGYGNTLFVTLVGTTLSILLLVLSAYPLSRKHLKGRGIVLAMVTFTMFFDGGMIPNYILIRTLQMNNTLWALILPGVISAFNLILMKNFIMGTIPASLEEAALVDGASPIKILLSIIFPLSKPAIATFIVFLSVGYWNNYFNAIIYCTKREVWPLMVVLREIVVDQSAGLTANTAAVISSMQKAHSFTLKMATIVVTTLPILIVYPFLQKYFIAGLMIGSVKE